MHFPASQRDSVETLCFGAPIDLIDVTPVCIELRGLVLCAGLRPLPDLILSSPWLVYV